MLVRCYHLERSGVNSINTWLTLLPQLTTVREAYPEKKSDSVAGALEGASPPPTPFERRACATRRPQGGAAGGGARARP